MIGDLLEVSPGYADLRKCDDPNTFESFDRVEEAARLL